MFFVYKWNNFLHSLVTDIIKNSINSDFKLIDIEFDPNDDNNQMLVDENNEQGEAVVQSQEPSAEKMTEKINEYMDSTSFVKYVSKLWE
jgi:hypothetical protein